MSGGADRVLMPSGLRPPSASEPGTDSPCRSNILRLARLRKGWPADAREPVHPDRRSTNRSGPAPAPSRVAMQGSRWVHILIRVGLSLAPLVELPGLAGAQARATLGGTVRSQSGVPVAGARLVAEHGAAATETD